jgi:hypothetical protein
MIYLIDLFDYWIRGVSVNADGRVAVCIEWPSAFAVLVNIIAVLKKKNELEIGERKQVDEVTYPRTVALTRPPACPSS